MPATTQKTISIKTFITLLELSSRGELLPPDPSDENLRTWAIKALKDEGLLEFNERDMFRRGKVLITVKGALALNQWKKEVKQETFLYRLGENILRLLWLIVGALIVLVSKLPE